MLLEDYVRPHSKTTQSREVDAKKIVCGLDLVAFSGNREEYFLGNGFMISQDGWMATAAHNFVLGYNYELDKSESFAYSAYGTRHDIERVITHRYLDLALVKIKGFDIGEFSVGFTTPQSGESVSVYSLLNQNMLVKKGRIVTPRLRKPSSRMEYFKDEIITNIPLSSGQSGSPIVSQSNKIVGIGTGDGVVPGKRGTRSLPYRSGGARSDEIEKFIRTVARRV